MKIFEDWRDWLFPGDFFTMIGSVGDRLEIDSVDFENGFARVTWRPYHINVRVGLDTIEWLPMYWQASFENLTTSS